MAVQEFQRGGVQSGPQSRSVSYDTANGKVYIRTHCDDRFIAGLVMDEGFGVFFRYRPGAAREQLQLLRKAALIPNSNIVLAFTEQRRIVGYVAVHPVSEVLRWAQGDSEGYYEFGAIEISREWRGVGLAKLLVETAFEDEWLEDKVVISYELCWHWDLDATGLDRHEYRQVLHNLLSRVGFKEYPTDEANILMNPDNLFMARVGSRVGPELRTKFLQSLLTGDHANAWWWLSHDAAAAL